MYWDPIPLHCLGCVDLADGKAVKPGSFHHHVILHSNAIHQSINESINLPCVPGSHPPALLGLCGSGGWKAVKPGSFHHHVTFYWNAIYQSIKGSRQWESRGVWNVSIEVCLPFNFAVVFDFTYFRFRPSKAKWIGYVLPNRRNAAMRSMFFSSFIMRIAYWRCESVCVIRRGARNIKKSAK